METEILENTQIQEAADFLAKGQLVAFPTETVYGLGICRQQLQTFGPEANESFLAGSIDNHYANTTWETF